jgi:excisionase family DNA binding protein
MDATEWLTAKQAAAHAQCSVGTVYLAVKRRRLRAARINGGRELRFTRAWIDEWLRSAVTIIDLDPLPVGREH